MWPFGGPLVRVPRSLAVSKQSASRYVLGCPITLCNLRASAADAGRACTWCLISIVALHTVCGKPFGMQRCRGSRALAYFADPKKNEDYDEEAPRLSACAGSSSAVFRAFQFQEAHHLLGNVIDSDDEQAQAGCVRT